MKILIDIGHPAHVHLFKNFAHEMLFKGNDILFTYRDKEFEICLLKANGLNFVSLGKKYKSILGKFLGLFKFDFQMWRICRKYNPDLLLSHGSPYAAHAAWFVKKTHIALEDTYNMEQIRLYEPFSDVVLTGLYEHPKVSSKEIRYNGYHELAYLYPKRFAPDSSIKQLLGIEENDKYILIRFVAWNATHDIGQRGLSVQNKINIVLKLANYAKVFVSSEKELPKELEPLRLLTPPERIHDVIAYSSLVFGESSTMAEEAVILGVPAIYLNNKSTYCTIHLERDYQLMYNLTESEEDVQKALEIGVSLLCDNERKNEWMKRRKIMMQDKIDVTSFLVWFIENYPESKGVMKENPDYQYCFK